MKRKTWKFFPVLILSLCFHFSLFAGEKAVMPIFIDYVGKGSVGVSNSYDSRALFFNPACIAEVSDGFYVFDFSYANSKSINEIFQDPDAVQKELTDSLGQKELYGYISLNGPLYLGFKLNNFQLAVFHYMKMDFRTYFSWNPTPGVYGDVTMIDDMGVAAGFAFPLPIEITGSKWEYLQWGFSLKVFQRLKGQNPQIELLEIANMSDPMNFAEEKLTPGRAVGVTTDFGIFYKYQNLSVGASIYNLLSLPMIYYPVKIPTVWKSSSDTEITDYYGSLPLDFGIGATYVFRQVASVPTRFLKDVSLSLEANEFLNNEDYPYLYQKFRLGLEMTLAKVVQLRFGLLHGALTFGLAYQFFFIKIDTAYWSEKIGDNTATNWGMRISFDF